MMFKSLTVFVLCFFCFVGTMPAHAFESLLTESVTPLTKGEKAPYEGLLLSKALAERIEAEKSSQIEIKICEAQKESEIKIEKSKLQRKIDIAEGLLAAQKSQYEDLLKIKKDQIDFLRENYTPTPWYESPEFLITVGIVLGVGLTIGAAHIVSTVK